MIKQIRKFYIDNWLSDASHSPRLQAANIDDIIGCMLRGTCDYMSLNHARHTALIT